MIIQLIKPGKKTPEEILNMLRARRFNNLDDPWLKYAEWLAENNIEATALDAAIDFVNDEDALAFRLKFGL